MYEESSWMLFSEVLCPFKNIYKYTFQENFKSILMLNMYYQQLQILR